MTDVSYKGLDEATVLARLYNAQAPLGLGMLQYSPEPMTKEQAQKHLDYLVENHLNYRFDYLRGRPLKVFFNSGVIERADLYDRNSFPGKCLFVVGVLGSFQDPNHPIMQALFRNNLQAAIKYTETAMVRDIVDPPPEGLVVE